MGKWFYYVRVSTQKQKTDRQLLDIALSDFCKRNKVDINTIIIMEEKESGKNFDRPQYKLLKQVVREDDNIIVSSIDRFGRNYMEGRKEFTDFLNKGVKVFVLDRPMLEELYKLNDNMSKFMINFLVDWELMNAEEELKRIKKRQRQGIDALRMQNGGKAIGRPKINLVALTEDQRKVLNANYDRWKNKEITGVEFAKMLNLKKNSFYNIIKEFKIINGSKSNIKEK